MIFSTTTGIFVDLEGLQVSLKPRTDKNGEVDLEDEIFAGRTVDFCMSVMKRSLPLILSLAHCSSGGAGTHWAP